MINKLKNIFFPKKEITHGKEFSNQYLMDKMERVFREILEENSFDDRLVFDYLIVLSPEIYNRIEVNSKIIIDGIIKRFYKVISEKKEGKEYEPLAKEWCIQFVPRDFEQESSQSLDNQIVIMSNPIPIRWNNAKEEDLQKVSINGKHSSFSNLNINDFILPNVNMLEKGKGCVKFNKGLELENSVVQHNSSVKPKVETNVDSKGIAQIKFIENAKHMVFYMKKNTLIIGRGNANEISTDTYLPVYTDDRGLKTNHFQIKYDAEVRGFSIAVFAPTILNEKTLTISKNNQELVWHPLTQKSAILCGLTQFDFIALKR